MALLVDAAKVLTLNAGGDVKNLVPVTNPRVRRRERQGPGVKAAAAAMKPQAKPAFSKTAPAPAPASAKVKEESNPAQPVQETAGKASSSGPAKKAAPALKRGASSGIMQAFSKAATKPAKVKKEEASTTPSSEDSSVQPMSDDGEDDEELPQPKPRSGSGFKSKRQREDELRRMMEEEEEEEEEASEKAETPEEEPMEEEPPAPEPVKEEETEVVTASANGRRRGKRRVIRKKQIMDDQGYLGMFSNPTIPDFSTDLHHSHYPGARVGVLLGGRASPGHQAEDSELSPCGAGCKAQEGCPERARQHHVFFFEEVMGAGRSSRAPFSSGMAYGPWRSLLECKQDL
jgi:DNA polymerase delta subunit 3